MFYIFKIIKLTFINANVNLNDCYKRSLKRRSYV